MPTFGDTTNGADEFPSSGDRAIVDRFALSETATLITSASAYSGPGFVGAGCSWKFIILSDVSSAPSAVLYTSNATAITSASAWFNFTFSGSPTLSAGNYWLGIVADSFEAYVGEDATGDAPDVCMANGTYSYATPPASWPGTDANYNVRLNVYVTYNAGSAAASLIVRPGRGFVRSGIFLR